MRIINEALTDIVYHFTSVNALINIFKTDKFMISHVFTGGDDEKINRGKFFYFSTTRGKTNPYQMYTVKLVLNGRRLSQNYKGGAVNYFGVDMGKRRVLRKGHEWEDRIFTNKPYIPDATKYILEIHVFLDDILLDDNKIPNEIKETVEEARKNFIPIFLYDKRKYWLMENKTKALDLDSFQIHGKLDTQQKPDNYYVEKLMQLSAFGNNHNLNIVLNVVDDKDKFMRDMSVLHNSLNSNVSYKASINYHKFVYEVQGNYSHEARLVLSLIVREMRKLKIKNFLDYVQYKCDIAKISRNELDSEIFNIITRHINEEFSVAIKDKEYTNIPITIEVNSKKLSYDKFLNAPFIVDFLKNKLVEIEGHLWDAIINSNELFKPNLVSAFGVIKKSGIFEIDISNLVSILGESDVKELYNNILSEILGDTIHKAFKYSQLELNN